MLELLSINHKGLLDLSGRIVRTYLMEIVQLKVVHTMMRIALQRSERLMS